MRTGLIVLLFSLFCHCASVRAQFPPSYYSVLHSFINNYDPELERYASFGFAKKPDGWYVQVLEREDLAADPSREYSRQYLYWSKTQGSYLRLTAFKEGPAEQAQLAKYWKSTLTYWYEMNRDLYFGYNGWDVDVIRELGGKADINDTLRESLARAYSNYAHRFLWYQGGGAPLSTDPLQQRRDPLAIVPEAAADSASVYIYKAVVQYRIIASHNPWYPTIVGSMALKLNNELMSGWQLMTLSRYPKKAQPFLAAVHFDSTQLRIGRKLLDECPPNTILITYGDNDSYQPWYVQEVFGYRKDVQVVNISMLGVAEYANWLKENTRLRFTLTRETFGRKNFYYISLRSSEDGNTHEEPVVKSIPQLLSEITSISAAGDLSTEQFVADSLTIPINTHSSLWKSLPVKPDANISPARRSYYSIGDLLLMDIVCNNISTRPICFTSQEDELFLPHQVDFGIVKELIPGKSQLATDAMALKRLEKVTGHEADFIPMYRGGDNQARNVLMSLCRIHLVLAGYYNATGKPQKKAQHLNAALRLVQQNPESIDDCVFYTGYNLILYNHDLKSGQALVENYFRYLVSKGQDYQDALLPPHEELGEQNYALAIKVFKEHQIPTEGIEAIWKQINPK